MPLAEHAEDAEEVSGESGRGCALRAHAGSHRRPPEARFLPAACGFPRCSPLAGGNPRPIRPWRSLRFALPRSVLRSATGSDPEPVEGERARESPCFRPRPPTFAYFAACPVPSVRHSSPPARYRRMYHPVGLPGRRSHLDEDGWYRGLGGSNLSVKQYVAHNVPFLRLLCALCVLCGESPPNDMA